MKSLTERQEQLLNFIIDYIRDNSMPPTFEDMMEEMNVTSKNAIAKVLQALEEKGYIMRDSTARGIKILENMGRSMQKGIISLPVIGTVSAGSPILAEEHVEEYFDLPVTLTGEKPNTFLLRVSGDSMINAGIYDGDLVVVEQTKNVRNNDIVVALLHDEVTVKRLISKNGKTYLKAENPDYSDIYPDDEWEVQGKVTGLLRQFH